MIIFFACMLFGNAARKQKATVVIYDFDQFDSLCIADSIPRDLSLWVVEDFYDNESESVKTKFFFDKGEKFFWNVQLLDDGMFLVRKMQMPW